MARKLRRSLTLPEVLLWNALKMRPSELKFRKQHPVAGYVADFACLSHRLIVEVDGEAHNRGDNPARDAARDAALRKEGFDVMRIPAREVLGNLDGVVSGIVARCSEVGPLHQPAAGPPPRTGEDLA
jgi:very-short-patch-repair endonuclease